MQRWLGENYQRRPNRNSIFWRSGSVRTIRVARGSREDEHVWGAVEVNESGKVHVGSRVVLWPQCCKQLELRFLSQQFPEKKDSSRSGQGSRRSDSGGCKEPRHNYFSPWRRSFFPHWTLLVYSLRFFFPCCHAPAHDPPCSRFSLLSHFIDRLWPRRCGRGLPRA